jgi:small-conductance mechanosensitive channel/CRP-like cAMP-binding protein
MAAAPLPLFGHAAPLRDLLIACAILLVVLLALQATLLERPWNRRIVGPIVLLVLALMALGLRGLTRGLPSFQTALDDLALLLLLLGLGRAGFVLVFHGLFHWLHRDVPKIYLDIIEFGVYVAALVVVLAVAGVESLPILTWSAVLSVVLGLALKDTLGNLFAGLAIQAQRPFEVGDWIQFDANPAHVGRVIEINWRSTTVVTLDDVEVIVPNGTLGTTQITNFTKPLPYSRRSVYVHAPYDVPPQRVHKVILAAIPEAWGVLGDPPPSVVTHAFDDRGVQYWVRFWTNEFGRRDRVDGGVRDCVWYALHRAGVAIPGPLRTVTLHRPSADGHGPAHGDRVAQREEALRRLDLFGVLSPDDLHRLAQLAQTRLYAPQEVIYRRGEAGEELFVVLRGHVEVFAGRPDNTVVSVGKVGPGEHFGEMALVTGSKRATTAQAAEECELLVIGAAAFQQVLAASPDLAGRVRDTVAKRQAILDDRLTAVPKSGMDREDEGNPILRLLEQFLGEREG